LKKPKGPSFEQRRYIPNPNPIVTVSASLSHNAKPDARAKNYLAIILNYCSTKTTDLQAKHKYTTKANLCIRVQTSDYCVFRYNVT